MVVLVGPFFVCGLTEDSFCSLPPDQMERFKKKFHKAEILLGFRGNEPGYTEGRAKAEKRDTRKAAQARRRRSVEMGFELTGATPDERLKELTEKLEQGVSEIFTSGRYAEYLSAMSKFHTYSFGNVMLILMQNPAASCVAGFHTWKKEFGRNVKAHESMA